MNAELLKNSGVDFEKGLDRFSGRADIYERALTKFTKDATFSRVRAAFADKDEEGLFAAAHELKGMCGNLALTPLFETSDELLELLRSSCAEAELAEVYERLEREYLSAYGALLAALEA